MKSVIYKVHCKPAYMHIDNTANIQSHLQPLSLSLSLSLSLFLSFFLSILPSLNMSGTKQAERHTLETSG